jgi:hypothetical protein
MGIAILLLAIFRLGVQLRRGAPSLPADLPRWQRAALSSMSRSPLSGPTRVLRSGARTSPGRSETGRKWGVAEVAAIPLPPAPTPHGAQRQWGVGPPLPRRVRPRGSDPRERSCSSSWLRPNRHAIPNAARPRALVRQVTLLTQVRLELCAVRIWRHVKHEDAVCCEPRRLRFEECDEVCELAAALQHKNCACPIGLNSNLPIAMQIYQP